MAKIPRYRSRIWKLDDLECHRILPVTVARNREMVVPENYSFFAIEKINHMFFLKIFQVSNSNCNTLISTQVRTTPKRGTDIYCVTCNNSK